MELGFIGLGRMGYNMVLNLLDHKHSVVVYDTAAEPVRKLAATGAIPATSLENLVEQLPAPHINWLMIPSKYVDDTLSLLVPRLSPGDLVIDGGNSYFEDSQRRYAQLKEQGINFLNCGTSGGMEGARQGACMMIGGDKDIFSQVEPLFHDMSVRGGYGYMGTAGAGHYVKMVHNAIEYGMMAAIAEGVQAIKDSSLNINPHRATKVYAHGSIISSRLVDWLLKSYDTPGYLDQISGEVPKGETEEEMLKLAKLASMPMLMESIRMRQETREDPSYAGKLLAAMRNMFGGHAVKEQK